MLTEPRKTAEAEKKAWLDWHFLVVVAVMMTETTECISWIFILITLR